MCQQFGGTHSEVGDSRFFRYAAKFLQVHMNPRTKKGTFLRKYCRCNIRFFILLPISLNLYYTILDTSCRAQLVIHVCVAQDCEVPLV